jgi:hypothetical protein
METNMNPEIYQELREKGQSLIDAAHEFWKVHQKLAGPRAVVWLQDTGGHFILFTRGEYRDRLLWNINPLSEETPLHEPFTIPDAKPGE